MRTFIVSVMQQGAKRKLDSNQRTTVPDSFPEGRATTPQLLGERGELFIEHNGREYRLRLTQSGKLILTA
jgi:hemin uptake protein HemP